MIDAPIGRLGVSPENPIWLRRGVIPADDSLARKTAEGADGILAVIDEQ